MHVSWLRRALLAAACASAAVIAACGGGTVVSAFNPTRVVAFGDAFSDAGQRGARYTVNDGSGVTWSERVAARYGLSLAASAAGGLSYATGSARASTVPDAAGNAGTPTISQQVDSFLAARAFGASDLVLVNGGYGDIVAEGAAVISGARTSAQASANTIAAATQLAAQIKRMADAGALHIGVLGVYDLGRSPWARQAGQAALLSGLASDFNNTLKTVLFSYNLGEKVLYVDAANYINLIINNPGSSTFGSITNSTTPACSSIDAGAGIGTGSGQVNSALCTGATITSGVTPATSVFSDRVYLTPTANLLLGDDAYSRLRARW